MYLRLGIQFRTFEESVQSSQVWTMEGYPRHSVYQLIVQLNNGTDGVPFALL
jgi:hypothetical protein